MFYYNIFFIKMQITFDSLTGIDCALFILERFYVLSTTNCSLTSYYVFGLSPINDLTKLTVQRA